MKKIHKKIAEVSHRKLEDGEIEISLQLEDGETVVVYAHKYRYDVPPYIPYRLPGFDFTIKPGTPLTLTFDSVNPRTAHIRGSHLDWLKLFEFCQQNRSEALPCERICAHGEIEAQCFACSDIEQRIVYMDDAVEQRDSDLIRYAHEYWTDGRREDWMTVQLQLGELEAE